MDEVQSYYRSPPEPPKSDIMEWWKLRSEIYSCLSKLRIHLLDFNSFSVAPQVFNRDENN